MRWPLGVGMLILGVVLLVPRVSLAQALKADYHTQTLVCNWTRGKPPNDGVAAKLFFRCGPATQQYTYPVKSVDVPQNSVMIKDVIPAQGAAFCVCTAGNEYGESRASPELSFSAGAVPTEPTSVTIK